MFSLKCRTEYFTHTLRDVYFSFILFLDENVIALIFTNHKPILKLAPNNSMRPIENDRLLAQHEMLFGWLLNIFFIN